MNCFLIALPPDGSVTESVVSKTFGERRHKIQEGVWVVAGQCETCADVNEKIGIGIQDNPASTGVVVKLSEYNGFAPRSLWEKLAAWERRSS